MKIFHIVCHTMEQYYPSIPHSKEGFFYLEHSVNTFVKNLYQLDTQNEHILVNISKFFRQSFEGIHKDGYKVIILPGNRFFNEYLQYSRALQIFIQKHSNDIFHIHGMSNFMFDSIVPYLKDKKVIVHHRGGHFTWRAFPFSWIKYKVLQQKNLQYFKKIIVETGFRKALFIKEYGIDTKTLYVVPGSIDTKLFSAKPQYNSQVKHILFVGRIEKNKGIYDLISSFFALKKNDIQLHICGEGNQLSRLRLFHSNKQNIHFYGHVKKEKLLELYHLCDIFVHPSYSDSFGLTVAEALSCGICVIATDIEGPASILCDEGQKFGKLFYPGDVKGLYDALQEYIDMSVLERTQMGKRGREYIEKKYNFEKHFPILLELYSSW